MAVGHKAEPQRMCAACREMKDKRQLLRIVRAVDGMLYLDFTGKKSGRGAYLCRSEECLKKARKTHSLEKALKAQIPGEVWDSVSKEILGESANE